MNVAASHHLSNWIATFTVCLYPFASSNVIFTAVQIHPFLMVFLGPYSGRHFDIFGGGAKVP